MDEPIAWPFWKFGLKRDDLFTTLQDRYNTLPSSIQDPEAFHHDVFELSHAASTAAEFHRLMAERKQHRLRELNESLESASFEIIANPSLIGTDQWQYAVQLFRTRSLDSLVRYFASYLPEDHPWRRSDASSSSSSDAGTVDSIAHSDNSDDLVFSKYDQTSDEAYHHYPLSPRSMTMYSDSSIASQNDTDHVDFSLTPARTMSFSESEPDQFPLQDSCPPLHHDDASSQNPSDGESSSTSSVSDESEAHHKEYFVEHEVSIVDYEVEYPQLQLRSTASDDAPESETPTPKPRAEGISARLSGGGDMFFPEPKPSRSPLSRASSAMPRLRRCDSPSRTHLSLHAATLMFNCLSSSRSALEDSKDHARDYKQKKQQQQSPSPSRLRRRDHSPAGRGRRSTGMSSSIGSSRPLHNGNSGSSRIQKPVSEPLRSRPRGRRLDDC